MQIQFLSYIIYISHVSLLFRSLFVFNLTISVDAEIRLIQSYHK